MITSGTSLKLIFLALALKYEPQLVDTLFRVFAGGGDVRRYKSGLKTGMLYISLTEPGDYRLWQLLNQGANRKAYERVQQASLELYRRTRRDRGSESASA